MPKFLLKRGSHAEGKGEDRKMFNATQRGNNVVTTDKDLAKLHGASRFERLPDNYTEPQPGDADNEDIDDGYDDSFGAMTIAQLKDFAEQEGIELKGAAKKTDIIRILRESVEE